MNRKIILYIALLAVALYAIPNTLSLLVGMHSFVETSSISCLTCHGNVGTEVNLSSAYNHTLAANNSNYTTYLALGGINYYTSNSTIRDMNSTIWSYDPSTGAWYNGSTTKLVRLDRDSSGTIDGDEVCRLCHDVALAGKEAHAATVKTCDDDRCHGNENYYYNSPAFFPGGSLKVTAAGYNLSRGEIHRDFYNSSSNQSSPYFAGTPFGHVPGNADPGGVYYSKGFYTCVTCHTDVGQGAALPPKELYNHSNADEPKRRY